MGIVADKTMLKTHEDISRTEQSEERQIVFLSPYRNYRRESNNTDRC